MRYTAIQNWSTNVYNLVTSRMRVADAAVGEWIDSNIGSKLTRKCPTIELLPPSLGKRKTLVGRSFIPPRTLHQPSFLNLFLAAMEFASTMAMLSSNHRLQMPNQPPQAQLFYLMSRGFTESEAAELIVRGFVDPITRNLPMEYASELNRLLDLSMSGAIG